MVVVVEPTTGLHFFVETVLAVSSFWHLSLAPRGSGGRATKEAISAPSGPGLPALPAAPCITCQFRVCLLHSLINTARNAELA